MLCTVFVLTEKGLMRFEIETLNSILSYKLISRQNFAEKLK